MKTILVPAGGGDSDTVVFATAVAVARPTAAHLDFIHVKVGPGEAAPYSPHVDFARGAALWEALGQLDADAARRSAAAEQNVRALCDSERIPLEAGPAPGSAVTASWHEETGQAEQRLIRHARHHDLIVMARARRPNGLPRDLVETVLLSCGRPILLCASRPPLRLPGTIMVCWRETPEAARALGAALPLLEHAERLVFVAVEEKANGAADALAALAAQFAWTGVRVEVRAIPSGSRPTQAVLAAAAVECDADLVVMGAYGHARMREVLFGGCTQTFIDDADRPVLMMH